MGKPCNCLVLIWVLLLAIAAFLCCTKADIYASGLSDPASGLDSSTDQPLEIAYRVQAQRPTSADGQLQGQTRGDLEGVPHIFSPMVSRSYLPFIIYQPICNLEIENNTGDSLCIEVFGTGYGQKCFESGTSLYGSFKADTYSYSVTAICGSLNNSRDFPGGDFVLSYSCTGASAGDSTSSQKK